jgi:hypothetical protein
LNRDNRVSLGDWLITRRFFRCRGRTEQRLVRFDRELCGFRFRASFEKAAPAERGG